MDSAFEGGVLDPSKCSILTLEEKRELVYEISRQRHGGPEMLQSWSRRELLQILCAEMGKERKYTGLTKSKMIEQLLRIISGKKSVKRVALPVSETQPLASNSQSISKRQKKTNQPSQLPTLVNASNTDGDLGSVIYCKNSACRAALHQEDAFCKRCSCCICYRYDDNKDPSLWLVCSSESPCKDDSCGLSCHLECALKNEKTGFVKDRHRARLDGSFYCIFCGKVNDLLGCWKKQLIIARDTRRVDILCYRISISQKILTGTEKYKKLYEIMDSAAKKLEAEVGSLAGSPVRMARGIVNRLSCGPEIQKLCASALDLLESMLSPSILSSTDHKIPESTMVSTNIIRFEEVCPTSLTVVLGPEDASSENLVGYNLWHRKSDVVDYQDEPTCTLFTPNTRFSIMDLAPATDYLFKVVSFCDSGELGMQEVRFSTSSHDVSKSLVLEGSQSPATNCSSLSNPSEGDESNNVIASESQSDVLHDAIKDICNSKSRTPGKVKEGSPGDSASALDEEHVNGEPGSKTNKTIPTDTQNDYTNSTIVNQVSEVLMPENRHGSQLGEEINTDDGSNIAFRKGMELVPFVCSSDAALPITPSKLDIVKDGLGKSGRPMPCNEEPVKGHEKAVQPKVGCSSKKKSGPACDEGFSKNCHLEKEYEYCVKLIRRLECEGHIEKNFRVKFLTWYSLRATPRERRIVKVFVDIFDDPACLAGQLVDTFTEVISNKTPLTIPTGFCTRLWH